MASRAATQGEREHHPDGHLIQYSEYFPNFAGTHSTYFYKRFDFHCNVESTSWTLKVTFQRVPNDGSVSFLVVIQRTDWSHICVDVDVWLAAFTPIITIRIPQIRVTLPRMRRHTEVTRTFDHAISNEILKELGDRSLHFQVGFGIHGCHVDDDLKRLRKRRETGGHDFNLLSKM